MSEIRGAPHTPVPVTVETDVFDDDTSENQVLAAVLRQLRTAPSLSTVTQRRAHHVYRDIKHVAQLRDPLRAAQDIVWKRHNQWYQQAISLAALLLSFGRVDHDVGKESVPGFFIDMPRVIEQWIWVTLRRAWRVDQHEMRVSWKSSLWLDEARQVELQPDLAIRRNGAWDFVGDVKYKVLPVTPTRKSEANRNDIYQMLAYLTATGLTEGVLIYAGIGVRDETITVRQLGASIHVVSLDLISEHAKNTLIEKASRLS